MQSIGRDFLIPNPVARGKEKRMPRPRIDPEKRLTEKVTSLLSVPEREALDKARKGRPVSEWIRDAILPLIRPWMK